MKYLLLDMETDISLESNDYIVCNLQIDNIFLEIVHMAEKYAQNTSRLQA